MRVVIFAIALIAGLSSCLRKIEKVDELNTNVFDKDYAGGTWFQIVDAYTFFNDMGLPRVRVEAMIEGSKMPGLKPSYVQIAASVNGEAEVLLIANLDGNGNYDFHVDALVNSSGDYCLTAGIYLEDEETTINSFTECTSL